MSPADTPLPLRRKAGSIALICIGLLILIPSGLCSAVFGLNGLWDMLKAHDPAVFEIWPPRALLPLIPLYGGPPIIIGALLLWWGLRRDRRRGGP